MRNEKKSTNYRSVRLLDMFWKKVLKIDKISSLKITNKKMRVKGLFAFACGCTLSYSFNESLPSRSVA